MKLFGKKKNEEFSDPLFKNPVEPLGPPDLLGLGNDGFKESGMLEHSEPRTTFAPMNVTASQNSPSFAPTPHPQNLERELQLINSKLDTLKAQLDALSLRLGQQKENGDRPRRNW